MRRVAAVAVDGWFFIVPPTTRAHKFAGYETSIGGSTTTTMVADLGQYYYYIMQ